MYVIQFLILFVFFVGLSPFCHQLTCTLGLFLPGEGGEGVDEYGKKEAGGGIIEGALVYSG